MITQSSTQGHDRAFSQAVKNIFRCPYKRKSWACAPFGPSFRRLWLHRKFSLRSLLKATLILSLIFLITLCLPRPDWLECSRRDYSAILPFNPTESGITGLHSKIKVVDPYLRGALRMYHIYNETSIQDFPKDTKSDDSNGATEVSNLNIIPSVSLELLQVIGKKEDIEFEELHKKDLLPECVHFSGPQEMKAPVICIYPREKDKVISMFLRDTGTWEMDRLIDMEWTLQAYTDMQLVDLGCNVGVFTLYAAGMGRHVLAVDVLPSNLKLLQVSLTLNDRHNDGYAIIRNATHLYPARKKSFNEQVTNTTTLNTANFTNKTTQKSFNKVSLSLQNSYKNVSETYKNKFKVKRKYKIKTRKMSRALLHINQSRSTKSALKYTLNKEIKSNQISQTKTKIQKDAIKNEFRPAVARSTHKHPLTQDVDEEKAVDLNAQTISQLVTLVHNAIYSDRKSRLAVYINPDGNVGGSEVVPMNSNRLDDQVEDLVLVDTICLDDLLPLVKAPSVYLKMDIEGSEPHALKCAQKFFEKVHVRFVLMEWLFQLRSVGNSQTLAPELIRFFVAKGFIPTTGAGVDVRGGAGENRGVYVLDINTWHRWPEMILWMER
ncbi:hypothetical protein BgiMline_013366 [Biomphalaria glabrata]|nr:hypothetical protein BgiMline_017176 [Biomphalaria glabrata]